MNNKYFVKSITLIFTLLFAFNNIHSQTTIKDLEKFSSIIMNEQSDANLKLVAIDEINKYYILNGIDDFKTILPCIIKGAYGIVPYPFLKIYKDILQSEYYTVPLINYYTTNKLKFGNSESNAINNTFLKWADSKQLNILFDVNFFDVIVNTQASGVSTNAIAILDKYFSRIDPLWKLDSLHPNIKQFCIEKIYTPPVYGKSGIELALEVYKAQHPYNQYAFSTFISAECDPYRNVHFIGLSENDWIGYETDLFNYIITNPERPNPSIKYDEGTLGSLRHIKENVMKFVKDNYRDFYNPDSVIQALNYKCH